MAGVLNLGSGGTPGIPTTGLNVYTPSGVNDGNGNNLTRRLRAIGTAGESLEVTQNSRTNYIRNGGFWTAQRQAPGAATAYTNVNARIIAADGWAISNENASVTYQRFDTAGGILTGYQGQFYGEFLKTTTTGKFLICQTIEGVDSIFLRNRTVRFTAWMRGAGGATPTVRLGLLYLTGSATIDAPPATFISAYGVVGTDPTFGTNVGKCTNITTLDDNQSAAGNNAYTCTLTATFQRFSGRFTIPNDAKNLIPAIWTDGSPTAGQGFDVGQCSLTDGQEIQDWSPLPMALELRKIQRFYQKSFAIDTAPVQNAGASTGEVCAIAGKAGAVANSGFITVYLPVQMRVPPGITLYNPQAANAQIRDQTAAVDHSATSAVVSGNGINFTVGSTGNASTAVGDRIAIHHSCDSEI